MSTNNLTTSPLRRQRPKVIEASKGKTGQLAWLAVPALVFFIVFAIIPLAGVFLLSFRSEEHTSELQSQR